MDDNQQEIIESDRREFSLGTILTIVTGRLLCPMGEVYGILNFLTGDNLFTHQLPRAGRICRSYVLEQLPQLAGVDADGVDENNWLAWLLEREQEYGRSLFVAPLPPGAWEYRPPGQELIGMIGPDKPIICLIAD